MRLAELAAGDSARLGLRYGSGPWEASGALFYTQVDDITSGLPTGGDRGAQSDLVSKGFEGSVGYTADQGFARLNYTYANVELDEETIGSTSYYLGRPVGHIFALEAGFAANDQWRFGGAAEVALENTDTEVDLPGYEVVNLHASYTPRGVEGLEIRLDVDNLFDETYSSRSSDGIDYLDRVVALTEPGRTLSLGRLSGSAFAALPVITKMAFLLENSSLGWESQ